jgi:hypothetical protein
LIVALLVGHRADTRIERIKPGEGHGNTSYPKGRPRPA